MPTPKRVVVVDPDAAVRRAVKDALREPDFVVHGFADAQAALAHLADLRPDLVLFDAAAAAPDGSSLGAALAREPHLGLVPLLALSGDADAPGAGDADDVVAKPVEGLLLAARVDAALRMAARLAAGRDRRCQTLGGEIGPQGVLPLVRFCEDHGLTGRLTVVSGAGERWIELLGGELVQAGGAPGAPGQDAWDAILATKEGRYLIEQRGLDAAALAEAQAREPEAAPAALRGRPGVPKGRLSAVEVGGVSYDVQTEAGNRPNFTVVTIVTRAGTVVRKTETSWQHPLQRREDFELAQRTIDRQHEGLVQKIREMAREGFARGEAGAPGEVDASLLTWALYFVVEQVWPHLGTAVTASLLRRTQQRIAASRGGLGPLRVTDEARVELAPGAAPRLPPGTVESVAAWVVAFLKEAGRIVPAAGAVPFRAATLLMEGPLERAGFYEAVEAARTRPGGR